MGMLSRVGVLVFCLFFGWEGLRGAVDLSWV